MIPAPRVTRDLFSHCLSHVLASNCCASRSVVQHWDLGTKLLPVLLVKWFSIHSREFPLSLKSEYPTSHCWEESGNREPEKITHRYIAPWIIRTVSLLSFPKYLCPLWEKPPHSLVGWYSKRHIPHLETIFSQMKVVWYSIITWRPSKYFWKEKICPARLELTSEVFSNFPFLFCLAPSPAGGRDLTTLNSALYFK